MIKLSNSLNYGWNERAIEYIGCFGWLAVMFYHHYLIKMR